MEDLDFLLQLNQILLAYQCGTICTQLILGHLEQALQTIFFSTSFLVSHFINYFYQT